MTTLNVTRKPVTVIVQGRGLTGAQGDKGEPGTPAPELEIQYSAAGDTWSPTYTAGDYYARFSVDGGSTWGSGLLIRGEQGLQGIQGPEGAQGPQGPQGAQGPQGNPAPNTVFQYSVDGTTWTTTATGAHWYRQSGDNGVTWSEAIAVSTTASDALNAPYEKVKAHGTISVDTTIDASDGNIHTFTVGGNITLILNPNCLTGFCRTLTLIITNGGAYIINWPASIKWHDGSAPTFTASGVDIVTLITVDAGTTWYGSANGVSYA